jgi:ribosome maturation factor RimP
VFFKGWIAVVRSSTKKKFRAPAAPPGIVNQIFELVEPHCRYEGLELVHVEYQGEPGGKILRLYIDKPGGVTLDDCVQLSRSLGDLLDVNLEDIGQYRLEVTSPGPNRPVSKKQDFERFKGESIKLKTIRPQDGRRNFSGVLMGIADDQVKLSIGDQLVFIPFESIQKANLKS